MSDFNGELDFDFENSDMDFSDIPEEKDNSLGNCPKCGNKVNRGQYGAYCSRKCGMQIGRAYNVILTDGEVKSILRNEKILLKGIKSKKGKVFDAYIQPDGIESYSYTNKEGEEKSRFQYKFKMTFPQHKNEKEE